MTPRLRAAILRYWYTYRYVQSLAQVPTQDRGSNIVSLDDYRKKYASNEDV